MHLPLMRKMPQGLSGVFTPPKEEERWSIQSISVEDKYMEYTARDVTPNAHLFTCSISNHRVQSADWSLDQLFSICLPRMHLDASSPASSKLYHT